MKRFKNIFCVVEPGQACLPALERAVMLAENNQASLTVVDVVERITAGIGMPEGGPISAELQAAMVRAHAQGLETLIEPQTHLMKGWARQEVPLLAKRIEVDRVVMGSVARSGVPGFFMGNTAETILHQIDCSVLTIKPSGFVTPVTLEA